MFSVGKPISILLVLMLSERGRIDFDAPVIQYWDDVGKLQKFLRKGG